MVVGLPPRYPLGATCSLTVTTLLFDVATTSTKVNIPQTNCYIFNFALTTSQHFLLKLSWHKTTQVEVKCYSILPGSALANWRLSAYQSQPTLTSPPLQSLNCFPPVTFHFL